MPRTKFDSDTMLNVNIIISSDVVLYHVMYARVDAEEGSIE